MGRIVWEGEGQNWVQTLDVDERGAETHLGFRIQVNFLGRTRPEVCLKQ